MSRILAIDYGSKRVGLAVTDLEQLIATPLDTVPNQALMPFLSDYFAREPVTKIVVGYPLRHDGSPTHATNLVEELLIKLEEHFPDKSITTIDEAFTSKKARESLVIAGTKKKNRQKKSNLDQISATLILQAFLEDLTLNS